MLRRDVRRRERYEPLVPSPVPVRKGVPSVSRLTRPAILLALLTTLAAVLAACGGGSSDDPNKLLKETFSGDHKGKSGKLNVAVDGAGQGGEGASQPGERRPPGP